MNAQTPIRPEPVIVSMFKLLPVEDQHRALQLMMLEHGYGENERGLFLSAAAWEIHPNNEQRQDDLYPIGGLTREGWARHYADAAASVAYQEMQRGLSGVVEIAPGRVIR